MIGFNKIAFLKYFTAAYSLSIYLWIVNYGIFKRSIDISKYAEKADFASMLLLHYSTHQPISSTNKSHKCKINLSARDFSKIFRILFHIKFTFSKASEKKEESFGNFCFESMITQLLVIHSHVPKCTFAKKTKLEQTYQNCFFLKIVFKLT